MVAYNIVVLPLIKLLKAAYPDVTQLWYTDDAGALGTFDNIGLYFKSFKLLGPGHGYYPKPPRSIIIVHPDNLASGK